MVGKCAADRWGCDGIPRPTLPTVGRVLYDARRRNSQAPRSGVSTSVRTLVYLGRIAEPAVSSTLVVGYAHKTDSEVCALRLWAPSPCSGCGWKAKYLGC